MTPPKKNESRDSAQDAIPPIDDAQLARLRSLRRVAGPDSPIYRSGLMMVGVPFVRRPKQPETEPQPPAAPEPPAGEG